jgi:hypothetical protein
MSSRMRLFDKARFVWSDLNFEASWLATRVW